MKNKKIPLWKNFCFLKKSFSYISKIHSKTSSYIFSYFAKWNFLTLILKNFLYFLKRKLSLYYRKRKPRKIRHISGKGSLLYFRKRKPEKTSYISGSIFPSSENKKTTLKMFLVFQEMEVSSPNKLSKTSSNFIASKNLNKTFLYS